MATGVKPRDEDIQFTRTDLENIQEAMKSKQFRDMLNDYCEEVRDPANVALYQQEMTQLEKERGYEITFINPKGGYVIKTSVAGDRKAFINICSNENVGKPSCDVQEVNGERGMNWQIPYSMIPPRDDYSTNREKCVIYDVVFHPDTLRMAELNKRFRELVNKTAFDALKTTYNIHLDNNNCRFPNTNYKGVSVPAVIRKEDPNYKPSEEPTEDLSPEVLDKLYPQKMYCQKPATPKETQAETLQQQKRKARKNSTEFAHSTENGYTVPKYLIKQQKTVDLQDYTYDKDSKKYTTIPSHLVVQVNLPLLSSTKDCVLDVQEKSLCLKSQRPAKYKLNITLPYSVNDECGSAKFDKTKHMLIVTLPVIKKNNASGNTNSLKVDSGVESEENSGSQSEEDTARENLIVELSSTSSESSSFIPAQPQECKVRMETFLDPSLGYILPSYTHNVLDDVIAFTFHVKNTEPDSVMVRKDDNKLSIKFTTVGSGFVPVHYAANIIFDDCTRFDNVSGEAWDNNVILQLELAGDIPQKFQIGLNSDSMTTEYFDISKVKKTSKLEPDVNTTQTEGEVASPVVEVTTLGTETNIVVTSNNTDYDEDDDESPTPQEETVWTHPASYDSGAKSILRKPMMRSFSESSVGDVASSMDYISSDCIPEESSLKKTVRFSDVIAKQFYRYNSSIEAQKKKNQRKKSKKRNQERLRSESEAEDDVVNFSKSSKPRLKSALKQRRDSGLADTSDAETDSKNVQLDRELSLESNKDEDDYEDNYSNDNDDDSAFVKTVSLASILNIIDNNGNSEQCSECTVRNSETPMNNESDEVGNTNANNKESLSSVLNIVDSNCNAKNKFEPAIWKSETSIASEAKHVQEKAETATCDKIKHNTNLYDPDRLNKGQYLEVSFKNDLIFDLDM